MVTRKECNMTDTEPKATCRYCHKEFNDPIDVRYISQNGMCLRCEDLIDEARRDALSERYDEDELDEEYEKQND